MRSISSHLTYAFFLFLYDYEMSLISGSDPARMLILGEGGTGKSEIIKAITLYFQKTKRLHTLRLTAPTGTAAANIFGITIHGLLHLMSSSQNFAKIQSALSEVTCLVVDECGFLGLDTLFKIDSTLSQIRSSTLPFGGFNILFLGDFYQVRPVKSLPLYASDSDINKSKGKPRFHTYIGGQKAWKNISTVIFLIKNYRTVDPVYQGMLTRLRQGSFSVIDYNLLMVCQ